MTRFLPRITLSGAERVWLVGLGLALTVLVVFFTGYSYTDHARGAVYQQMIAAEKQLASLHRPADVEQLRVALVEAETRVQTTPSVFPKQIDNLVITALLANAARLSNVEVTKVETGAQTVERLGSNEYRSLSFRLTARGQFADLIMFLNRLETSSLGTLIVVGQTWTPQAASWTVILELTAYAQKS